MTVMHPHSNCRKCTTSVFILYRIALYCINEKANVKSFSSHSEYRVALISV